MKEHRNLIIFLLMLILVPLAGEPKIHPFSGELSDFRVSFGSPIFLLFLLWLRNTPFIAAGFFTGITVVVFRALLDFWAGTATFNTALWLHLPTFFYYFVYATCFHMPHFDEALYHKALQIAGWSIIAEIIASIAELFTMSISISGSVVFTPAIFLKITAIAVLRCFFILSFFFLSQIYTAEMRTQQEHKQKQRMMLLISNLYEEVVQLDKSQKNAEEITRNCYNLYENLQSGTAPIDRGVLAAKLLAIAGRLHDIKKDNQRIHAGLVELTNNRQINDYTRCEKLARLILDSQRKYAASLGKTITFTQTCDALLPPLHVYTILSLVNNLIANAVEAITEYGTVQLSFAKVDNNVLICLKNTGSFISPERRKLIFKPGYTTKFDVQGNSSTGVGLPYVKHLTTELGGTIDLYTDTANTVIFTLLIPLSKLKG